MKLMLKRRWIVFFLVVGWLLVSGIIWFRFHVIQQNILSDGLKHLEHEYLSVVNGYRRLATYGFNRVTQTGELAGQVGLALDAGPGKERDRIRGQILAMLSPDYQDLTALHFRQVHIHFPDSVSFLRVHRPDLYGDSLAGIRYTVDDCNREKRFVEGFEEGRVFNGYRFVFPLTDKGRHVGSLEISISLQAVTESLMDIYGGKYEFLVSSSVVRQIVFPELRNAYKPSILGDAYFLDVGVDHSDVNDFFQKHSRLVQRLKRELDNSRTVSHAVSDEAGWFRVQFMPVPEYSGRGTGYLVVCMNEPELARAWRNMWIGLLLTVLIFSVIGLLLIRYIGEKARRMEMERFLPICANCRKVRVPGSDGQDMESWMSLEEYFHLEKDALFTHGICPACKETLYGDYLKNKKED